MREQNLNARTPTIDTQKLLHFSLQTPSSTYSYIDIRIRVVSLIQAEWLSRTFHSSILFVVLRHIDKRRAGFLILILRERGNIARHWFL